MHTGDWWGNLRERYHLEDRGVRRKDNIKMDLREVGWWTWNGLSWLRIGEVVGFCECGNELAGSIKYRVFHVCPRKF